MLPADTNESKKVKKFEMCYHHAPEGIIQEPRELKGIRWIDAREPITTYIEQKGFGKKVINYHLRDWL
jgi:leucyl-tRNA synthetase